MSVSIKYPHFVATVQLELAVQWAKQHATGNFCVDTGAWRDKNPYESKGIEFEFENDAKQYLTQFSGVYERREVLE